MTAGTGDAEIDDLVGREQRRWPSTLYLIAGETEPTPAVRSALGTAFDAKWAEGYPDSRYHGGVEAAQRRLGVAGIVVDKAVLPLDGQPVTLGLAFRIGTPSVTSAGLGADAMSVLAAWIDEALQVAPAGDRDKGAGGAHARIRGQVAELLAG